MSLIEQAKRYGVLAELEAAANENEVLITDVQLDSPSALCFAAALIGDGWTTKNILRLFGIDVDAAQEREPVDEAPEFELEAAPLHAVVDDEASDDEPIYQVGIEFNRTANETCGVCHKLGHTRLTCGKEKRVAPARKPKIEPIGDLTRDMARSRRAREVRAKTLNASRNISKRALHADSIEYKKELKLLPMIRPKTRADCANFERPCPFVGCKYNLYLDEGEHAEAGSIKLNFPDLEPHKMKESCSLDVADRGGATLEETGAFINVTRERVRQIEVKAVSGLRKQKGQMIKSRYADDASDASMAHVDWSQRLI